MKAEPLKKSIYNKAKEQGIEQIILHFSGGSDEGYLDVETEPTPITLQHTKDANSFRCEIEEWAWEVYDYSGAGEGSDYGDDIVYDLKNGKVTTSEWFSARQEGYSDDDELQLEEE
jgi:hypothetical protein